MYSKIRKLSLVTALCLFAVSLSGATVMLASAEEQNYYVCFSNQNYSVRNANKMEYAENEYVLKNVALSSAVDFYVTDNSGMRWYARDNAPLKVEETQILDYNVLFSPTTTYENGSHISYRFYEPDTYSVSVDGTPLQLSYNPYHTAYDLYYISSVELSANTTVSFNGETHTVTESGFYRILFTPEKTVNGNKYLFDENGNYGSGDDYKYSVYIEDAPQYYAVFENVTAQEGDTQINGKSAFLLTRYENNVATAEYRSAEVFAPERDYGIKYRIYELNVDGSFRLIDDDNNEDTEISKITVSDTGWYCLSLTDVGENYHSAFVFEKKNFGDWYLAGEFNGYCFDKNGNIDLSGSYKFTEIENDDEDYNEDYPQYIAYLTVNESDLKGGSVEFYITDGKTKFKDGGDYIEISIAGTYKIICSDEHNYGRGRNFRYVLQDENKDSTELLIGSADEFIAFAKNCSKSADYSVNLKVYLTSDIDFSGKDFVPVGTFSGTFYGGYHKLKNVVYTDVDSSACVFKTLTHTATVERLTAQNITLGGKNTEIAGIVGTNYGKVYGVSVSGKITGKNNVGGVVAVNGRSDTETGNSSDTVNKATIENCKSLASVTGETFVGGVCGRNTGNISSCENSGTVNGNKTYSSSIVSEVGGVAGYSFGKIYDCVNTGKIEGGNSSQYVGGIAGLCVGEVYFSINRGNVSADKYAGGIVGFYGLRQSESSSNGIIGGTGNNTQDTLGNYNILNYNTNYGDVCANSYVGGVVGNVSALSSTAVSSRVLKIYNCASVGNLEADAGSYVGGIAGNAVGSRIQSCLSSGTIQAKGMNGGKYVGGIVGYGGDISYSMSSATLKGTDYIGGIAGYASSAVIGCYTNVVLLPSTDAEYIGGIAGYASNYNVATNEFTDIVGNYYIGTLGGICGTDYEALFNNAAVSVSSEVLSSVGILSPVLCEEFSREYWLGGKDVPSYPVLLNFEQAEECSEFDDEELFNKLFAKNAELFSTLTHNASEVTYTVTFMEWNKDNGDLYADGLLQKDNFDIVSVVRVAKGGNAQIPALIFAQLNGNGKYVYEGSEARYFVCFPTVENVNGNLTVYAEYREIVTSLADPENRIFAESEFVKGTEIELVKIGEYYTLKFTLDGEEITVENITLKYFVGDNAEKFNVSDAEGQLLDYSVSGKYISFDFTSGNYFKVIEKSRGSLPFWAWLLIGIGGTVAVSGLTVLTVYLIKKKVKNKKAKKV